MNFELSQEQQLLADSLKRFVTNDYTFEARGQDRRLAQGAGARRCGRPSPRWGCWACRFPPSTTASAAPPST